MSSKGKDHKAALKMVQRWEKELSCEFDYDVEGGLDANFAQNGRIV
jgi:hypothetical protein